MSIIVPAYNVASHLPRCLDSILSQTYPYLEVIVIDDGSIDNTEAICTEYALKDSRIKVMRQTNKGVAEARNSGLDMATGQYVGFVDPDDAVLPQMFASLVAVMEQEGADIVQCGVWVDTAGEQSTSRLDWSTCTGNDFLRLGMEGRVPITLWCNLYSARIWEKLRFESGYCYEDEMLFPQLALRSQFVARISQKFYIYSRLDTGIVRSPKTMMHLHSKEKVFEELEACYAANDVDARLVGFCLCKLIPSHRLNISTTNDVSKEAARTHIKKMHALFCRHFANAQAYPLYATMPLIKRLYWKLFYLAPRLASQAAVSINALFSMLKRA
ncbi:glycosyltransferase family 2 protein [Nitratidesulfovibrio vulgaris]|uniref:glycosyltransferase family 2 protein n=1 Tax=Nitratidesulfovibrio vulgaris TaxID=881 RepID=UPI002301D5BD|nr:glycosyltransferase [Nitratidesulfovibrio vulgaris]WCB48056.1 glycosyltransferase [Nitratidesulfovibrio vulgaris]